MQIGVDQSPIIKADDDFLWSSTTLGDDGPTNVLPNFSLTRPILFALTMTNYEF